MQGLLRTGLMTSRARARRKVGRSDAREGAGLFYNQQVPLPADGRRSHALDVLLQFCPVLGAKPELKGTLSFRQAGDLNLKFADGRGGARPFLFFPDSRRPEKRWDGFKKFTELVLREDKGRKVIWAGSNFLPDKGSFPPAQFLNLTGNTSLVSLPALIRRADWVVTNDSGPMHLAAALHARVLGIFGPTDPRLFGPYPPDAPTNFVIQAPVGDLKLLTARDVNARFARIRERLALS
jgi:ADP-heptose:LPS heptosyltransferase